MDADPAVAQLCKIAFDDQQQIEIRFKATLAIIDRAGLSPRTTVDLEVNQRPFETIFEQTECGSRSDFRNEPELLEIEEEPEQFELEADEDDLVIDVDVVDAIIHDEPEDALAFDSEPESGPFASSTPVPDGLITLDAAVSAATAMRRQATQRALTRGG
jgi:hypothetical protein